MGRVTCLANGGELTPLEPPSTATEKDEVDDDGDGDGDEDAVTHTSRLHPTTRAEGYTKQESMKYHFEALRGDLLERIQEPSIQRLARLIMILGSFLLVAVLLLVGMSGDLFYDRIYLPIHKRKQLQAAIRAYAEAARVRAMECQGINWRMACDRLGAAGARRKLYTGKSDRSNELEDQFFPASDTITYDEYCLPVYRLELFGGITFPYHSIQSLHTGGNFTMALFIQHGAMRNAMDYFCSFTELMELQDYRDFQDVLIIAPNFNYENDELVHPQDAFWNSSKPWGDWRVGAESDPKCCGNQGHTGEPRTVSSFEVLDNMLAMLTDRDLFPLMDKISYVGHSAGTQTSCAHIDYPLSLAALADTDVESLNAYVQVVKWSNGMP